jgi:hypothetical protein
MVILGTVIAAAILIPIPIVHLIGIPLVLLAGLVAAIRQAQSVARLEPMRLACPRCGAENAIGGGLGYRNVGQAIPRPCESCRRPLTLHIGGFEVTDAG